MNLKDEFSFWWHHSVIIVICYAAVNILFIICSALVGSFIIITSLYDNVNAAQANLYLFENIKRYLEVDHLGMFASVYVFVMAFNYAIRAYHSHVRNSQV